MSASIFWSLIGTNIAMNLIHGISLAWADYPRATDGPMMARMTKLVMAESGVTNLKIIAFVNAVN
jgi:hypothetical protein